jgi:hypothetical protein
MVRFLILRLEVERRGKFLGSLRRGVNRGLRAVCMEVQAQEAADFHFGRFAVSLMLVMPLF